MQNVFGISDSRRESERQVKTNDKGEFLVEHVPQGVMRIGLNGPVAWWQPKAEDISVTVVDGQTTEITLNRVIERHAGQCKMRIVDPTGKPYAGPVSLAYSAWPLTRDKGLWRGIGYSTDIDGILTISLNSGNSYIALCVEGYVPIVLKGVAIKDDQVTVVPDDLKLSTGVILNVKLTGLGGRNQVADNGVILVPADAAVPPLTDGSWGGFYDGTFYSGRTDAFSEAEIRLPPGDYFVKAIVDYGRPTDEMKLTIKPDDKTPSLEIDFSKRSLLAMNMVDKDTGGKIANVSAWMYEPQKPEDHIEFEGILNRVRQEWNEKGQIVFGPRTSGHEVRFWARGYKPVIYKIPDVPAGKTTEVTVPMEKFGKGDLKLKLTPGKMLTLDDVSGIKVADANDLYAAEYFSWLNFSAFRSLDRITPRGGFFVAKDLSEGACYVRLFGRDGGVLATYRVDVEAGKTTEATLAIPDKGDVDGALCDDEENPIPNEIVSLMPYYPALWSLRAFENVYLNPVLSPFDASTDNDGHFIFRGVPEGKYFLLIEHNDGVPEVRVVSVKPGVKNKIKCRLEKPFSVTVTLKMPEGESIPENAVLNLVSLDRNPSGYAIDRSAWAGIKGKTVEIEGICSGRYLVEIVAGDSKCGPARQVEITPQNRQIEMAASFKPGNQKISGKIRNLHGKDHFPFYGECVVAVSDTYRAEGLINDDGSFELAQVPPGRYRIVVLSLEQMCLNRNDFVPVKEVTVEEGKNVEGVTIP